jgi:VWFA-related protein
MLFRVALGLLFASALTLAAQQPPAAPPADQPQTARFGTAASGVVVDVVVRDKKGRPVTNLSAADFEILEDSVRQQVVAFEPYTPADVPARVEDAARAAGLIPATANAPRHLAEGPPIIALAWDRLEPEGRAIAYRAARRLIETKAPGELVGVFLTDMTLRTIAPYTTDSRLLGEAVEILGTAATSSMKRETGPLDGVVGRASTPATASAAEAGNTLAGFPKPVLAGDRALEQIIKMLERMERTYQAQLYEAQGRASMLGLFALIDSLGQLPGRKTVFYFCEGLTIPDSQLMRYRAVIDTANRNNVSIYTFDAAGLRVHSAQQQTAREMRELTFTALGSEASKPDALTQNLETNERLLKMDPSVSLGILADQTGGLLIDNTNALDRAVDLINDDRRHHYLLSYVSTNSTLDGAYRKIDVRVGRPDVEVRARRGYRATAEVTSAPVLEYERPAMIALAASPAPSAFPIAARAIRTPMPGRPGLISVLVGVGGRSIALGRNDDGTQYFAGATVLTRVVDRNQREVARASQQYQFTGDYAQRNAQPRGILFFKTATLLPGPHTLQAVVYDVMAEKSSVLRIPVEAMAASDRTLVGDVIVARTVERVPAGQPGAAEHPLVWKGMLYTPSFGEPISLSTQTDLTVALPTVVVGETLGATIELRRGDEIVATARIPVDAPQAGGRVVLVGRLPIADVPAGEYETRVTVAQPGQTTVRTAMVTIVATQK